MAPILTTSPLHLTRPAYPAHLPTLDAFRADPNACYVCCNLCAAGAATLLGRWGLHVESSDREAQLMAQDSAAGRDMAVLAGWCDGKAKAEYTTCKVTARLGDVVLESERGCAGCRVLREGVEGLVGEMVRLDDPRLFLDVTFTRATVMRVLVYRLIGGAGDGEDEDDMFGFEADPRDSATGQETVMCIEFYTLPGKPCPWPTIGSQILDFDPEFDRDPWVGGEVSGEEAFAADQDEDAAAQATGDGERGNQSQEEEDEADFSSRMVKIRHWITECTEHHASCPGAPVTMVKPKRLIDVGTLEEPCIRLHEIESPGTDNCSKQPDYTYTALSHCWGLIRILRTLKENVDAHKKEIPAAQLTNTFRDAVRITRSLGVRYVWIDSLCIIQDDARDWEIEAAKMGFVYSEAYIVISAMASADGRGGCLQAIPPEVRIVGWDYAEEDRQGADELEPGKSAKGKPLEIYAREAHSHYAFFWGFTNMNDVNPATGGNTTLALLSLREDIRADYPLVPRAWCYQERLLARRMIYFTKLEVVFECLAGSWCQCGALAGYAEDPLLAVRRQLLEPGNSKKDDQDWEGGLGRVAEKFMGSAIFPQEEKEAMRDHFLQVEKPRLEWYNILTAYSSKSITQKTDILPAIAGIASIWAQHQGRGWGRYLAGLWAANIVKDLAWVPMHPDPGSDREGAAAGEAKKIVYKPPTWSWASLQRPLQWPMTADTWLPTKYNAKRRPTQYFVRVDLDRSGCVLLTEDSGPYGRVKTGWLRLAGPAIRCTLEKTIWRPETTGGYGGGGGGRNDATEEVSYHIKPKNGDQGSIKFSPDSAARCNSMLEEDTKATANEAIPPANEVLCMSYCADYPNIEASLWVLVLGRVVEVKQQCEPKQMEDGATDPCAGYPDDVRAEIRAGNAYRRLGFVGGFMLLEEGWFNKSGPEEVGGVFVI